MKKNIFYIYIILLSFCHLKMYSNDKIKINISTSFFSIGNIFSNFIKNCGGSESYFKEKVKKKFKFFSFINFFKLNFEIEKDLFFKIKLFDNNVFLQIYHLNSQSEIKRQSSCFEVFSFNFGRNFYYNKNYKYSFSIGWAFTYTLLDVHIAYKEMPKYLIKQMLREENNFIYFLKNIIFDIILLNKIFKNKFYITFGNIRFSFGEIYDFFIFGKCKWYKEFIYAILFNFIKIEFGFII